MPAFTERGKEVTFPSRSHGVQLVGARLRIGKEIALLPQLLEAPAAGQLEERRARVEKGAAGVADVEGKAQAVGKQRQPGERRGMPR